ncbi:MAG TPA: ATP-binding protein [Methanothrix sp.]|nr:ATP-binding protein [Methanothrix sp.]HQJ78882.1 ATP-binding protein [Methanothrix sp.]
MDGEETRDPPSERAGLLERRVMEKGETTYRIVSKNVSEYHFIVPYDLSEEERAEVGQIFSVRDGSLTYLARVLDIEHSSNYDGHWDTTIKGTNFFDSDQIFNRVVAEPLGCVNEAGGFRKSRTLPTKFSPVKRAEKEQFRFLSQVMGDIEVGYLRNGSRLVEEIPVALHSQAMDHHMGVFATTGMGKSNFMKVFAASCMRLYVRGDSNFGLLIVDPHGEYLKGKGQIKGLTHLQKYRSGLACYSTDRQNASDPGVEELAISEEEIFPEDIALLYEWSPPQRDALDAISRIFDSRSWLEDIKTAEGMARMMQEGFKDSTVSVLVRRIKNELERNQYIKKRSSLANILANLKKGKVVLVDIPRMADRSELFLLSVISRYILDEYKKDPNEGESRKNCLITIEEAQRVLGAGSNTSRFESIAREGRKFGVGLCAITQQPKLIDKQLLSQFNTLVVMGLGDRNDRRQLEESAKQDLSSLDIEIQTLEKGEAVVSTLGIPFPVPARIHRYEDYLSRLEREAPERTARKGGFKPFLE